MAKTRKKLCMVFNYPTIYRKGIYSLIENTFDTLWNFGENHTDLKEIDPSVFKHFKRWKTWNYKSIFVFPGLTRLAFNKKIGAYVLIGQPGNISIWLLAIASRIFNPHSKVYYWCHGLYSNRSKKGGGIKKIFMRLPHEIFLYGNYAKECMIEMGFNESKLHVIHNSLDYDTQLELRKNIKRSDVYRQHFGNDYPTWIFLGRLTPVKKLNLIIEALYMLKENGERYNLVFVGDGSERAKLEELTKEKDLTDSVWFYGACFDEKVNAELVYNADLCVSPGNVGLTAMHTMMFGVPVITHNCFSQQVPEFESIREGETGAFYNYGSIESLVDTVHNWFAINNRELVRQACMKEIDDNWNPQFQINLLKEVLDKSLQEK